MLEVGDSMAGLLGQAWPDAFRVWSDRSASELEALEWNPCMDLLACLSAPPDSTLSIYRLLAEDQNPKLLSEKITGIGTSLAWSPDGRQIAVGDRLGGVTVYDGESGAVLHMLRPHQHPVAALDWVGSTSAPDLEEALGGLGLTQAQWARMLPPLLAIPTSVTNLQSEEASEPFQQPSNLARGLLCSVDVMGGVAISAGGAFLLKVFQLSPSPQQPEAPQADWPDDLLGAAGKLQQRVPKSIRLSPDFRTLAVLLGGSSSSSSSSRASHSHESTPERPPSTSSAARAAASAQFGHDILVALDVRSLAVRQQEIRNAATLIERLTYVSDYTVRATGTMAKLWRAGIDVFGKKMHTLQEILESYAFEEESKTLGQEMLVACFSGLTSDALQTFLMKQTSPQQLLRLERTVSQLFEYVSVLLSSRLRIAVQYMLVLLAQLEGLASYQKKYKVLGLDAARLSGLKATVEDFSNTVDRLLAECVDARCCTKTTLQVLLRMIQRLPNQAPSPAELSHIAACGSPTQEELERFFQYVQSGTNFDLSEVTACICGPPSGASGSTSAEECRSTAPGSSLKELANTFAKGVEELGSSIQAALSQRTRCVACLELDDRSPWSVLSNPDLRSAAAAAANDFPLGLPLPGARGLGHPVVSMSWTTSDQLLVLWTGGPSQEEGSGLHLAKLSFGRAGVGLEGEEAEKEKEKEKEQKGGGKEKRSREEERREARKREGKESQEDVDMGVVDLKPQSKSKSTSGLRLVACERASLWPQRLGCPMQGNQAQLHFVLASPYDEQQVVCILIQESKMSKDVRASLALLDVASLPFESLSLTSFERSGGLVLTPQAMQEASCLEDLLEDGMSFRQCLLPKGYVSASCLRPMASRGVCSVYAWRGRRLLTLDMEADNDEDDGDEDADMSPH